MKKIILYLLLVTGGLFLTSCADLNDPNNWKMCYKGTIKEIKFVRDTSSSGDNKVMKLIFEDSEEIIVNGMLNPETCAVGQTGILYKFDQLAVRYKWIENKQPIFSSPLSSQTVAEPNTPLPMSYPSKEQKIITSEKDSRWNKVSEEFPPVNELVLLKSNNGSLSIGYITRTQEWKLDINKFQLSGGITISDVSEWRNINLE